MSAAILAAFCALLLAAAPARAAVLTWTLSGVTFADGGTATGSFNFDASTSTISSWNIQVSGGNTGSFPVFTYDGGSSAASLTNAGNPADTFFFDANGGPPTRGLRLTPVSSLTDGGGNIGLELGTMAGQQGNLECFNCSPFRFITAGALIGAPPTVTALPAPLLGVPGLVLVLLMLPAIEWVWRRRRVMRP